MNVPTLQRLPLAVPEMPFVRDLPYLSSQLKLNQAISFSNYFYVKTAIWNGSREPDGV